MVIGPVCDPIATVDPDAIEVWVQEHSKMHAPMTRYSTRIQKSIEDEND